jgi:flagellar protein FlbD
VILVHRLKGQPMFLNADLIESVESTPDTVVTLADGRRYVVADKPEEIVERSMNFRASVLVAAEELRSSTTHHQPPVLIPLDGGRED